MTLGHTHWNKELGLGLGATPTGIRSHMTSGPHLLGRMKTFYSQHTHPYLLKKVPGYDPRVGVWSTAGRGGLSQVQEPEGATGGEEKGGG